MFVVKVKPEIIQHCQSQIQHYNFGKRSVANGNKEQQLTGIIGQCVVMDIFGQGYIDGSSGCDNGTDIEIMGYSVDVKTMGRTTDVRRNYVNNFIALQLKFNTKVFIFCSYHKTKQEITVYGWIPKSDFLEKASFFPKGSIRKRSDGSTFQTFADLYEISNALLNDVDSADNLKIQIENWCHTQDEKRKVQLSKSTVVKTQGIDVVQSSTSTKIQPSQSIQPLSYIQKENKRFNIAECAGTVLFSCLLAIIGWIFLKWTGVIFGLIIGLCFSLWLCKFIK